MESNESPEQSKKENTPNLSSFSSDIFGFNPPRRIKSEPLPELKFLFDYFSDNKNTSNEDDIINVPSEMKHKHNTPEIKSNDNVNILLNSNSHGFKGRSPYVCSPSGNNSTNKSNDFSNNSNNNISSSINTNNSKVNSSQKIINGFIFTELKDKVFEYRCSVCNFVAHSNVELRKHLALNKHFILPKKYKKANKAKIYHKQDNRLNQTFMYSMNKPKKYYEKKIICKHCSKRFESNYALNSHLNAHKYKCDICYKLFNNKEDLIEHKHNMEDRYEMNSPIKKKSIKGREKNKIEIDDWGEASSSKKEKKPEIKKDEIGESYAFIEDTDENLDFNKMVKINDDI